MNVITRVKYGCTQIALCVGLLLYANVSFSQLPVATFPLNTKATKTLVDSLSNQLLKFYVFADNAKQMSDYIKERCKKGAYNNVKDPHVLAAMLTKDVASVHLDEHFHVEYNPKMANELLGYIDDVPKMVAERLNQDKLKNFGFKKVEILNGNIGYLEISSFSRLNDHSQAAAAAALGLLANANALIIDLRYGKGGSPEMINYIVSHFFKEKTHVSDIYMRCEKTTLPYWTTPPTDKHLLPLTEMPIYILTSYKTFSAAEGLTFELQSLNRAVVVGETTRGGAHTVTYRPLSSGFVADVPFGRAFSPETHANWEGVGIEPDIKVSAENALETAELKIFENALANTKDENEIKRLNWQRDLLQSVNHPTKRDTAIYKSFVGDFGAYNISYSQGTLYYQKAGKAKFVLLPLKGNTMKIKGDDSFRVEFFKDEKGAVNKMATYYDDWRVEYAEKNR